VTTQVRKRGWIHPLLFVVTAASLFGTFAVVWSGAADWPGRFKESAIFTVCMLLVTGSHEMGHFLLARRWKVDATWPYFIPLPLLGFGTLGAVIRLKGRVPHRDALVDIGAAGPLAGLFFAVPMVAVGIWLSRVDVAPQLPQHFPGDMSLWHLLQVGLQQLRHQAPDVPDTAAITTFGDNLLIIVFQRLIKGPLPPGHEVYAHPVLIAGWFGCLMTMLNLMPVGQLDGGHLTHALFGKHAVTLGKVVALAFAVLAVLWSASWLVWLFVTAGVIGFKHPPTEQEELPLSRSRMLVCIVCFVFTVLCFMPVPIGVS